MHRAGLSPLGLSGVHRFSYRVVGLFYVGLCGISLREFVGCNRV